MENSILKKITRRNFMKKTAKLPLSLIFFDWFNTEASSNKTTTAGKKGSGFEPAYLKLHRTGELKKRAEKLWSIMEECQLCPRECGVNRLEGTKGFCHAPGATLVVSASHQHFGEERPLVGNNGSGTIFLTHCNLRCVFCQNWEISQLGRGHERNIDELAGMMLRLQKNGCHNINLVTPTHYSAHILTLQKEGCGCQLYTTALAGSVLR
jgi:putative pyruvate formate lyase activating enzyme